jgi:hypothetical protein
MEDISAEDLTPENPKKPLSSKGWKLRVLAREARFRDMAAWHCTKGNLHKTTPDMVYACSAEIKIRVVRGEGTIEEFEEKIYRQWGDPTYKPLKLEFSDRVFPLGEG